MLDYKKIYQIMVTETEKATNTLIAAQRRCEAFHQEELFENWTLAEAQQELFPIAPLR